MLNSSGKRKFQIISSNIFKGLGSYSVGDRIANSGRNRIATIWPEPEPGKIGLPGFIKFKYFCQFTQLIRPNPTGSGYPVEH